jgi:hypothetical protein
MTKDKKNKGGRPPKYHTAVELQKKIDEYFEIGVNTRTIVVGPANHRTTEEIKIPTITGLVLYCGFCNRASFYDLEKNLEFSHTIKKARARIEQIYEEQLHSGTPTGAIFALKNFGWFDRQELSGPGGEPLNKKDTKVELEVIFVRPDGSEKQS